MLKYIILFLFIFNGTTVVLAKSLSQDLLSEAVEDSDKEKEVSPDSEKEVSPDSEKEVSLDSEEPPTLLESINNTEKAKNLIQRELAKAFNFKLGSPANKAKKQDGDKKSISFVDVDLQVSERPEEILVKKKSPNRNTNSLIMKSKKLKRKK